MKVLKSKSFFSSAINSATYQTKRIFLMILVLSLVYSFNSSEDLKRFDEMTSSLLNYGKKTSAVTFELIEKKVEEQEYHESLITDAKPAKESKTIQMRQPRQRRPVLKEKKTTVRELSNLRNMIGKNISFELSLRQIEEILARTKLSKTRSVLFWENLIWIKQKSQKSKEIDFDSFSQMLTLRSNLFMMVTLIVSFIVSQIQQSMEEFQSVESEAILNVVIGLSQFILADLLYTNGLVLASTVSLLHILHSIKCFMETFVRWTSLSKSDVDLYVQISYRTEMCALVRLGMLIVLSFSTLVIFFLMYPVAFNFILGYQILFKIVERLGEVTRLCVIPLFQPVWELLPIAFALGSFVISKLFLFIYPTESNVSFQLITDLFFFFHFYLHIGSFVAAKAYDYAHLLGNGGTEAQVARRIKNVKEEPLVFGMDDWLHLLTYSILLGLVFYALYARNYIVFVGTIIISAKLFWIYFSSIHVDFIRPALSLFFFVSLSTGFQLAKQNDIYFKHFVTNDLKYNELTHTLFKFIIFAVFVLIFLLNYNYLAVFNKVIDTTTIEVDVSDIKKNDVNKPKLEETIVLTEINLTLILIDLWLNYMTLQLVQIIFIKEEITLVKQFFKYFIPFLTIRVFF